MVLVLVGTTAIWGEVSVLEAGRRKEDARFAAEAVAEKITAANKLAAARQWDGAVELLRAALNIEGAANLTEARMLLAEVQRSRADALLQSAETAVAHKDTTQALTLIHAYLADPAAVKKDRATRLQRDLELATSDAKAGELLRQLRDDTLAAFVATGTLPALDQVRAGPVREIYAATLQTQLAPEQQRRAEVARQTKEEQQKREIRIGSTPAFKELQSFMAASRNAKTADDPRLLAYLMKELNITNPADQKKALAELAGRDQGADLTARVARERIALKDRFRAYTDFDEADRESFERMVDLELDRLLHELQGSAS
jgi:hypothetical protein